jgi:asparagine synthase (glutamine-hydrolysing)
VLTRKKTGFGAPVRLWVAGRLRGVVEDVIGSRSFGERGVFDPVAVKRALDDTIEGRRDGAYLILSIVLVELWLRRFIDRKSPPGRTTPAARLEGCASGLSFAGDD